MITTRSAAALAAAACLAVLAGCASHGNAPGAGATRSPGTSTTAGPSAAARTTAAPSAAASTPAATAPAAAAPGGTGTVANPFNGMCMALAADRTTVVAWKCSPGASTQQWTGYSDGTLRINGRCLAVTGPGVGAKAKVAACTGAASQKWVIGQVSSNDFGPLINTGTGTALADPGGSTANGTPLVTAPDRGDQTGAPWHVSFHHYSMPPWPGARPEAVPPAAS